MPTHICPTCSKVFSQKGHLTSHLNRAKPCVAPAVSAVEERLKVLETELVSLRNQVIMPEKNCLNAISLFSGGGGDTMGLEKAGYTVIAFNEFNEAAAKTHMTLYPESVALVHPDTKETDIKKIPDSVFVPYTNKVHLIFAGFPCFIAGTRVLTDIGYMPIESVSLENKLMTHTGTFQPIINLQQKIYDGELYSIRIKYHPEVLVATSEHPFYVREKKRIWDNTTRKYTYVYESPKWKAAHMLEKNDYFGMAINTKSCIPTFTVEKRINKSRSDTYSICLSVPDQWFMMGYFIGDGWIQDTLKTNGKSTHIIRFAIHNKDTDVLKRLQRVLPLTNKLCSSGACDKYGCADIVWHTILKKFGKYAHGKIIPEWVQDAPSHLIQEFLNGYIAADGHLTSSKGGPLIKITTVSYNLALGVQRLYMKLGFIMGIYKCVRPKTCIIQGRTINQRDTYTLEGRLVKLRNPSSFIEKDYVWLALSSIQHHTTEPVPVFNFEVHTDNSYIVDNTIVHNCQGFSHAGKKKSDDKRNELVHEFVRVTNIIQPEWIIGENVKGLLARKGRLNADAPLRPVIDIIRDLFEGIGYRITYKVLDVSALGVPQNRKRLIIVGHKGSEYPHVPWETLEASTMPIHLSVRPFLESHLQNAMELPVLYKPADQGAHYWIITTETEVSGTPHKNLDRLVRGIRNRSGAEKAATNSETNQVIEPGGLISFGVRKGGYHGMVINPDVACNTIISTYNLCPRLFVGLYNPGIGKYWIRCMTAKELGQIQGFPADYAWQGTEKQAIIQIGNAVPPPLAERVARTILARRVSLQKENQSPSVLEDVDADTDADTDED